MFNVKVDDFNIQFTFQHMRDFGTEVGVSDVTRCVLIINGVEHQGIAACSEKDVFNKEVGRKISLKRALAAAREHTVTDIPLGVRTMIWWRYFERHIPNGEWIHVLSRDTERVEGTGKLDPEFDKPRKV